MSDGSKRKESRTMNHIPMLDIQFVADDSLNSEKRQNEVTDILVQVLTYKPTRGRPKKSQTLEVADAA